MSLNEIPTILLGGLRQALQLIKATVRLPFFQTYMTVSFCLIILFTILTFPYETILLKEIYKLEKKAYKSIAIGELDFNIIGKSSINNLSLVMLNGDEISANEIVFDFDLSPFNFISKKQIKGAIEGRGIKYSAGKIDITCNANSNLDLTLGTTSKDFTEGTIKVMMENVLIESDNVTLPDSMMNLQIPPIIKASSTILDASMKNRKFLINNFMVSGPDLSGTVRGNISLSSFLKNSRLNLKISVKASSAVLSEFAPMLKSITDDKGIIKFPLKGTLGRPKPEIKLKPDLQDKSAGTMPDKNP